MNCTLYLCKWISISFAIVASSRTFCMIKVMAQLQRDNCIVIPRIDSLMFNLVGCSQAQTSFLFFDMRDRFDTSFYSFMLTWRYALIRSQLSQTTAHFMVIKVVEQTMTQHSRDNCRVKPRIDCLMINLDVCLPAVKFNLFRINIIQSKFAHHYKPRRQLFIERGKSINFNSIWFFTDSPLFVYKMFD